MKAVSDAYRAARGLGTLAPARQVLLYRRLGDASGWDASPIDVTSEVQRLDRLVWKLDTDALNEFKAANLRILVENANRQWDQGGSRFSGRLLHRSKVVIRLGLVLADGSPETYPAFTGVIEDLPEDSDAPVLQLELLSMDLFLSTADAYKAASFVTDELVGIGDGIKTDYELIQYPVGMVMAVRVGGETLRAGTRWTAKSLNDHRQRAVLSFNSVQPAAGAEIRADYLIWKTQQRPEQVVQDLLSTVPEVAVDTIQPVSFSPPAQREILHTRQADFLTYDHCNTKVEQEDAPPEGDGQITIDPLDEEAEWKDASVVYNVPRSAWTDINFKRIANGICAAWDSLYEGVYHPTQEKQLIDGDGWYPWQEYTGPDYQWTLAESIFRVTHSSSNYRLYTSKENWGTAKSFYTRFRIEKMSGEIKLGTILPGGPNSLHADIVFSNTSSVRVRSGNTLSSPYNLDAKQWHTYRLDLNSPDLETGTWALWVDDVQVRTGNLANITTESEYTGCRLLSTPSGETIFEIDYIRVNHRNVGLPYGVYERVTDFRTYLGGIISFGLATTMGPFWAELQSTPATGVRYFYQTSDNGTTWTPYAEILNGGNVGQWTTTSPTRFLRFKVQIYGNTDSTLLGVKRLFLPGIAASFLIDGGTGIQDWLAWKATVQNRNGGILRATAIMPENYAGNPTFYRALGAGDTISSDDWARQEGFNPVYLLCVAMFNTAGVNPPLLQESILTLTTSNVPITSAQYGTRKALDIIKEVARIADYEVGVGGDGRFFFRNKAVSGQPVLRLDHNLVEKVLSYVPGWDRVYNSVRAQHGQFEYVADSASQGDPVPTSERRFGTRTLEAGGDHLVFQEDVDLATVIARRYWARYKEPKRRATVRIPFMPELELGDLVVYDIASPRRIGDAAFNARVVGLAHDAMEKRTEVDVVEV
ncbi:MAG: hypothetical protein WC728_03760 [Elusimicrobiota bacterium]